MANLLMQLIFVTASSAQQGLPQLQHTEHERQQQSVQLAECFTRHFSFPCVVQALAAAERKAVHRPIPQAQVSHCVIHTLAYHATDAFLAAVAHCATVTCMHNGTLNCA